MSERQTQSGHVSGHKLSDAVARLTKGDVRGALMVCRDLLRVNPGDAAAHQLLGVALMQSGKIEQALVSLKRAVELAPDNMAIRHSLASTLMTVGSAADAVETYRSILAREPDNVPSLMALGEHAKRTGDLASAVGHFRLAAENAPSYAKAWVSLGEAEEQYKRSEAAEIAYRRALALSSGENAAICGLARLLIDRKEWQDARDLLEPASVADPQDRRVQYHLAVAEIALGARESAAARLRDVVALYPAFTDAAFKLISVLLALEERDEARAIAQDVVAREPGNAMAHLYFGWAHDDADAPEAAIAAYRRAVEIAPDMADAHYNLGVCLGRLDRNDEAIAAYRDAIRARPDMATAHYNLGVALQAKMQYDDSIAAYRQALLIRDGDYESARLNLANVFRHMGRYAESIAESEILLGADPDNPRPHFNKGLCLMHLGRLREGWAEYDWRERDPEILDKAGFHPFRRPRWEGQDLGGKTLLVFSEQGYGDALHFARYVPMAKARGARILLECRRALATILATVSGVDEIVIGQKGVDPDAHYDYYIPIMSLPRIFDTTVDTIPANVPYIAPPADRVAHWADFFAGRPGLKVGLVWSGNPKNPENRRRSCTPADMAPLAAIPGVRFFSLQGGPPRRLKKTAPPEFELVDLAGHFSDFAESAAIMANLDLVISTCTAPVHLAGALGRPVWVALQKTPDWRWFLDRDDSPWYPTARLFRQRQARDWASVFEPMAEALRAFVASR